MEKYTGLICFQIYVILLSSGSCYDNLLAGNIAFEYFPPTYSGSARDVTDGNTGTCHISDSTNVDAFIRLDLQNVYNLKEISYTYRPAHVYRITPIRIFLSNVSNNYGALCYEWTDFNGIPPESGTFPCVGTGRFLTLLANRGSGLPAAWRPDDPRAAVSYCELSAPGCRTYGRFGDNCERVCNCETLTCDYQTGSCPGGRCAAGWTGPTCSDVLTTTTTTTTSTSTTTTSTTTTSTTTPQPTTTSTTTTSTTTTTQPTTTTTTTIPTSTTTSSSATSPTTTPSPATTSTATSSTAIPPTTKSSTKENSTNVTSTSKAPTFESTAAEKNTTMTSLPSTISSTSMIKQTATPSALFFQNADGVGAGAIAAVAMVALSLIIVIGLIVIVGISFKNTITGKAN